MCACEIAECVIDISFNIKNVNIDKSSACIPLILITIPTHILHIITGCMLGDGSIRRGFPAKQFSACQGSYCMTIAVAAYDYHKWLFDTVFASFCSIGRVLTPWPNPNTGKPTVHHAFSTLTSPILQFFTKYGIGMM